MVTIGNQKKHSFLFLLFCLAGKRFDLVFIANTTHRDSKYMNNGTEKVLANKIDEGVLRVVDRFNFMSCILGDTTRVSYKKYFMIKASHYHSIKI